MTKNMKKAYRMFKRKDRGNIYYITIKIVGSACRVAASNSNTVAIDANFSRSANLSCKNTICIKAL